MKILSYILVVIFLLSGGAKLASLPFELEAFARWGYPLWFMYLTGVLEVTGAIGLIIPRLSALASACLAALMLGAIATHIIHSEWPMFLIATAIASLSAFRAWTGRKDIFHLLKIEQKQE